MIKASRNIRILLAFLTASLFTGAAIFHYKKHEFQTLKQDQNFQAIIFDLDGTIIDTDPLWKQAGFCVLKNYTKETNATHQEELIKQCQHLGIYETVLKIIEHLQEKHSVQISTDQLFQESMPHLRKIYQEQGIQFIPYFQDFHKKLTAAKLKTAVATSSQQHLVELISNIVPLENYFGKHIYHVDHVNRAYKPKPDVYLHAAEKLGVPPHACIAIEDSATGIKAAKAAGMYCIGINTGKNRNVLAQADEIVDCFSHINLDKLLVS